MKQETWKDILGYEGLYQVSDLGRVRSVDRIVQGNRRSPMLIKGKVLRPDILLGYLRVDLYINSKRKIFSIHRLVAKAFHKNPNNLPQVNHLNGVRNDNRATNLEWVSHRENGSHGNINRAATSKYVGVSWVNNTRKWRANIRINGRNIYLGYYHEEEEARDAYLAALEEHGLVNKYA